MIKALSCIFVLLFAMHSQSSSAADGTSVKVSDSKGLSENGTLIIQKSDEKFLQAPKVFVESGSDTISGSPESHLKAAYRTWETACQKWKAELRQNNRDNLMIASCGEAERSVETLQSEKVYSYKSKGTYKVRVIGK